MAEGLQQPVAPGGAPVEATGASDRDRLEQLRRFHLGDPEAGSSPPPDDFLPAALHSYRGSGLRGGWPLMIVADAGDDRFVRPLDDWLAESLPVDESVPAEQCGRLARRVVDAAGGGETDLVSALTAAAAALADELDLAPEPRAALMDVSKRASAAVPGSARLVALGRRAPLLLVELAARRRLERARRSFAEICAELSSGVAARLAADRDRRPDAIDPAERLGRMGALGARFFDAGEVSGMVTRRRAGEPLEGERRRRLEEAGERLGRFVAVDSEPVWVVPESIVAELDAPVRTASDPCAASAEVFDELAAAVVPWVVAARLARLETADAFDPVRHTAVLDRLDVWDLDPAELALVPPVLVLLREAELRRAGLESLSRLLRSGRPVQVVVLIDESASDPEAMRFEPAYFGVGHREAFVHQGSTARPAELVAGFQAAFAGSRPALHVVDAPSETPSGIDRAVVAAARLSGRVAPIFRYQPQAGSSWARRMHFEQNPAPEADWPLEPLPAGDGEDDAPQAAPFTFADAVLLEPERRAEFSITDLAAEDLMPLADWLRLDRTESARRLPFVWGAGVDGRLRRAVVTRRLAEECRSRLGFWRTLEELAGIRNEHVEAAVARAREDAAQTAACERAELEEAHRAELERIRQEMAAEVVQRLVAGLLDPGGALRRGGDDPVAAGERQIEGGGRD